MSLEPSYYTFNGESVTMYSMTGKPSEARVASATCRWRNLSSSSIPASNTNPTYGFNNKIITCIDRIIGNKLSKMTRVLE